VLSASAETPTGALGIIIGISLLIALSLLIPPLLGKKRHLPLWLGGVLAGHTEFLFIGLLLGPGVLGLFDETLVNQMKPFLTVGLGWVGLFFGLQWDLRKVKRFPRAPFMISGFQALVTFAVVTGLMALALWIDLQTGEHIVSNVSLRGRLILAALLGVVASVTAPIGIGWMMASHGARGQNTQLAQFLSATDGVLGVLLFGLVLSALSPTSVIAVPGLRALGNFCVSLILGAVLGWLAHFILQRRWNTPDYVLWLIGLVVLSSGAAHGVMQSPLVVNFVMGAVLVNLSHQSERVIKSLGDAEVPFYIVFLILGGATWTLSGGGWASLLILPYIIVRILGKTLGVAIGTRVWHIGFRPDPRLGLAMLSQGGLALAMIISVGILLPEAPHLQTLETIVIVAIVINQMLAPAMARRTLAHAGELSPA
jgi:hypothetical protein